MLSVFIGLTFNPYLGNKKLLKLNMRTSLIILMLLMQMLSTNELIAQEKHKIVTAQNGDGIISLQTRHGLSPKTYQAEFIGLNKQKLGKQAETQRQVNVVDQGETTENMGNAAKRRTT